MKKQLPATKAGLADKCIAGHIKYESQQAAQRACDVHIADAKHNGLEGKAWKRLNVYRCRACGNWHVGHKKEKTRQTPAPQPKPMTAGQARRKMERAQKEAERHAKRAALFADYLESVAYANALLDKELALAAKATKR